MSDFQVAEFWSSANPGTKVRMLCVAEEIAKWAAHPDFIRWVDDPDAARLDYLINHPWHRLAGKDACWFVWDVTDGLKALYDESYPTPRAAIDAAIELEKK